MGKFKKGEDMKKKKYYREWLGCCGWGVMLNYDSIIAKNKKKASQSKPNNMYACDKSFEIIKKIKEIHLEFTDKELSHIYGNQKI